jgi:glycosyltransferase involved in cell wall biosynthesis
MKNEQFEVSTDLEKNINFILPSRFPTEKAHGVVTVEMAKAALDLGFEVAIIAPNLLNKNLENPQGLKIFLLDSRILKKIVALRDSSRGVWSIIFLKLQVFLFFISLLKNKKLQKNNIYWLRDITLTFLISRFTFGKKKFVLEVHRKPTFLDCVLIKLLPKKHLVLIPISKFIEDNISKNAPRSMIAGMAVPKWFPREKSTEKKFTFGYFGSYSSYGINKNVEIVLEALHLLNAQEGDKCNAIFVGVGEEGRNKLVDMAKNLGIKESQLKIVDNVDHELVPDFMKECENLVFPYPYVKGIEGSFPTKLLEYASVNCSIIASDTPISRQIFTEKEVWFYESLNPISFVETYLKISSGSELPDLKILAARQLVDQFMYEARVVRIIDFLRLGAN